jgi:hypothetical protein
MEVDYWAGNESLWSLYGNPLNPIFVARCAESPQIFPITWFPCLPYLKKEVNSCTWMEALKPASMLVWVLMYTSACRQLRVLSTSVTHLVGTHRFSHTLSLVTNWGPCEVRKILLTWQVVKLPVANSGSKYTNRGNFSTESSPQPTSDPFSRDSRCLSSVWLLSGPVFW